MKQKIVKLIGFIVIAYLLCMTSTVYAEECDWHRQKTFSKEFYDLALNDETENYKLILDTIAMHPTAHGVMYRVRTFKRKDSEFAFEDLYLRYYFKKPTTNDVNKFFLVEAKWWTEEGHRYFWNVPFLTVDYQEVFPNYYGVAKGLPKSYKKDVLSKPYRIYIQSTLCNSIW